MKTQSQQIEDIILQHGKRGMKDLQKCMKPGYCRRAAQMILDSKGVVVIGTGFPVSGSFESDGPIGAIALYRILVELGYEPVFACAPPISLILSHSFLTYELPLAGWDESRPAIKRALRELEPSLIVSIERPGVSADGRYYNMHKKDITADTAKFDLFLLNSTCPSICFGDGGNEIGMGVIAAKLRQWLPFGNQCRCGCGGGIVPITKTDFLMPAAVSNWGAYGISAMLAVIEEKREVFHSSEIERRVLLSCIDAGLIDGGSGYVSGGVDSLAINIHMSIVNLLEEFVNKGIRLKQAYR